MTETVLLARLRTALSSLLSSVERVDPAAPSPNDIVILLEEEARAASECLMRLGLEQDALALVQGYRVVTSWLIGPVFEKALAEWAAKSPGAADGIRKVFGDFPSLEELAERAQDRQIAEVEALYASRTVAALIRQLCSTFCAPSGPHIDGGRQHDLLSANDVSQHRREAIPAPSTAPDIAIGWPEILETINRKNADKELVRRLNNQFGGPIAFGGTGAQPMADKAKLRSWWASLVDRYAASREERAQQEIDREATLADQYRHGKEGHADTEAPGISGRVKRRRTS
jgi:hypothetical protein